MTVGLHAANLANKWLDMLAGTAFPSAPAGTWAKLHTADPGSAGTTAPSAETTRKAFAWAAAAGGVKAIQATSPSWLWAAGTETITHVSVWDAVSGGNFLYSYVLTASKTPANGDTLNLSAHSFTQTPLAA